MSSPRFYITTAIPYVNGDPHVGFALECVQADVLARHRRQRGDDVRFLSGTDENSLKNVEAAAAAGVPVAAFVDAKAARFAALRDALELSTDDFIRTSVDPRHRPGVERLWRACAQRGDLYQRDYEGLYCTGCESFLTEDELAGGHCAEHGRAPERVVERNWFFALSRYEDRLLELLDSGRIRIEPEHRRNEVLEFVRGGLSDFSVSRPRERARGWGIPVPGDPAQVVYVWFDALANYITALGYGGDEGHGGDHRDWWHEPGERVHIVGKGITRFHAVYWPAILLSAGEPLPTSIFVHDYLTANGAKLSKSSGSATDPAFLCERYGSDALRWWFARDVVRSGDTDFREDLVVARSHELAGRLGNLVNRTIALVCRYRPDGVGEAGEGAVVVGGEAGEGAVGVGGEAGEEAVSGGALRAAIARAPAAIDEALGRFDLRAAAAALWQLVDEANRFVTSARPWELAKREASDPDARGALDETLALLLAACNLLARELAPFLPAAARRIELVLATRDVELGRRLFVRLEPVAGV
ncbi:MAG: methionyl-tRNA synthetase [bacterium]